MSSAYSCLLVLELRILQILIASHVGLVRRSLQLLLEQQQYKVLVAESIDRAHEILAQNSKVDVVICEWKLEGGTAFELQRRSQQIGRLTDGGTEYRAPNFVVFATPSSTSGQSEGGSLIEQIRGFGFQDVLEKPVDRSMLIRRLGEIAKNRSRSGPAVGHANPPVAEVTEKSTVAHNRIDLGQLQNAVTELARSVEIQDRRIRRISRAVRKLTAPGKVTAGSHVAEPIEHGPANS